MRKNPLQSNIEPTHCCLLGCFATSTNKRIKSTPCCAICIHQDVGVWKCKSIFCLMKRKCWIGCLILGNYLAVP
ncbi:hypothetical protein NC652_029504 [Populus alba x Populus x berolinensis]|nr:hypothetical protein NC652_029504 [Populus alba x Populus x berolinensis]